jgi:C1A family cysteine protease
LVQVDSREYTYKPQLVVSYTVGNAKPTIELTQPASDVSVSRGEDVLIAWDGSDPDDNAIVFLYYDSVDCDGDNGDGTLINLIFPEDGTYNWNTGSVPYGTYRIRAVIDDGQHGADVGTDCASGSVTITGIEGEPDIRVEPASLIIEQPDTLSRVPEWVEYVPPPDSLIRNGEGNETYPLGLVLPDSVRDYWLTHRPQLRYSLADLPSSIDWSVNDSPVKSQGLCGSCWAFSAVGLIENLGHQVDLSEQVIVSCTAGDCDGGWYWDALAYAKSDGVPLEACYPYTQTNGVCGDKCSDPPILEYVSSHTSQYGLWGEPAAVDDIKATLQNGPLVVTMRVPVDNSFNGNPGYQGGVYNYDGGPIEWNGNAHAVLVVGYNDDQQCFKVKNSFGKAWGENGYFRIAYDDVTDDVMFGGYGVTASGVYTVGQENVFSIHNGGEAALSIYDITGDRNWLSTSGYPALPLDISPGDSQTVIVNVDWLLIGQTSPSGQITVSSNDPDESSVFVDVTAVLSDSQCEHFAFTSNTGDAYTIVIDSVACNCNLKSFDEIGVFDGDLCVGASVFAGNWPVVISAWVDDNQTVAGDGYTCGDSMTFAVWQDAVAAELSATAYFTSGDGSFCSGPYARLYLSCMDQTNCCGRYNAGYTGNTDFDYFGELTLWDIVLLIDRIYISQKPLCCEANGNTSGDVGGSLSLDDVISLIDHIYINHEGTAACK